jgi:hypothetical protein
MQEVRTTSTMTSELLSLGDWLAGLGVTRVVMEATSDYWRRRSICWRTASRPGWSTPTTSSTCGAAPRPTGLMRCGSARSPATRYAKRAAYYRATLLLVSAVLWLRA